jgi:predicted transcriptional regulator
MKTNVAETSIEAFHSLPVRHFSRIQNMLVEYVRQHGTATIAEMADGLGLQKSTVSGDRNRLMNVRLERVENRVCRITGKTVQAVKVRPFFIKEANKPLAH